MTNSFDAENQSQNRRVLIIDDQKAVHDDFRKILIEQDDDSLEAAESLLFGKSSAKSEFPLKIDLRHAYQGEEGAQVVQQALNDQQPIGLAFVDVRMPPGIDGIQTARQLWRIDPDLQIVICTAYSDYSFSEVIEQLDRSDQFLLLKKPFEIVGVRQIVSALLRRWELNETTKKHIQLLKWEHEKTRAIINSSYGAHFVADMSGNVIGWTPESQKLLGWTEDEVLNHPLRETVLPVGALIAGMGPLIAQADDKPIEMTARCRDGRDFPCEITLARFPNPNGGEQSPQLHFFLRDISERLLEESRQSQTQKLEAIGQLAAGIAHEINTPTQYVNDNVQFLQESFGDLTEILGSVDELIEAASSVPQLADKVEAVAKKQDELDMEFLVEEIPRSISQSLDGLTRISSIVRAMKEFSHPDGETQSAPFDVNRCITSTTTVARNEWKYVADLVLDLAPELPPAVGHKGEFNQTILNLVINAAHAIEAATGDEKSLEKGKIEITTRVVDEWLEIQLSDTGTGIPAEVRDKIFDPFFTTKQAGKGTGQGLSIAINTLKKHGGSIWFDTEDGVGTTFFIRLPSFDSATVQSDETQLAELSL